MQNAGTSFFNCGRGAATVQTFSTSFNTNQGNLLVDVWQEQAECVGPTTKASHKMGGPQSQTRARRHGFFPDDSVKFSHHHRIGMRSNGRANHVMCVGWVRNPESHGFIGCVLQRH